MILDFFALEMAIFKPMHDSAISEKFFVLHNFLWIFNFRERKNKQCASMI